MKEGVRLAALADALPVFKCSITGIFFFCHVSYCNFHFWAVSYFKQYAQFLLFSDNSVCTKVFVPTKCNSSSAVSAKPADMQFASGYSKKCHYNFANSQ